MTRRPRVAIARGLSYAPYADLLWCETSEPNIAEARKFAEAIHEKFPEQAAGLQLLAVVQLEGASSTTPPSPSSSASSARWATSSSSSLWPASTSLNLSMFELARAYKDAGMAAYSKVQQAEFAREAEGGYHAVKHQRFVGTGYFDQVAQCVAAGKSSTTALTGSTEENSSSPSGAGAH